MNEMKVYRALQKNAGAINNLVVRLYKGKITAEEALKDAKAENDALTKTLKGIESADKI